MNTQFRLNCLKKDISNFSLLRSCNRNVDGYFISMQHSGTHWFKYMIGLAISHQYRIPPPQYIDNKSSNSIVGNPKRNVAMPGAPYIGAKHSIPPLVFENLLVRKVLKFPRYVVLIRDIRHALVSNYEKWKHKYSVSFGEYLDGDISERKYVADIWWFMHFMNRWGEVESRLPGEILVFKYEEAMQTPVQTLTALFEHFGLPLSPEAIEHAVSNSSKESMAAADPASSALNIIRKDKRDPLSWYAPEDREKFNRIIDENLAYDFGYKLKF